MVSFYGSRFYQLTDYISQESLSPLISALGAKGHAAQPTDEPRMTLSTPYVLENQRTSEISAVDSSDRLWEVEQILQTRIVRGRRLRVKRAKRYKVQ